MILKHLDNRDMKVPVKIWNVETKELIMVAESILEAAKVTGLSTSSIISHIWLKTRSKAEKNKLRLLICFR